MISAMRKHLFASNILFLFIILIIQKFTQVFCIIEEKACKNANCPADKRCKERCVASTDDSSSPLSPAIGQTASTSSTPSSSAPPSPTPSARGLRLIPMAMLKTTRNFGFGEGHFQIFVEEKQRQQYISKSRRLHGTVAEVKSHSK